MDFWPGEFHGQRGLAGYSSQGCKELDMTERLTHIHIYIGLAFSGGSDGEKNWPAMWETWI